MAFGNSGWKLSVRVSRLCWYSLFLVSFDDTAINSKCGCASGYWQHLKLASELESDLRDTMDWVRKWIVEFNAGKTQIVSFDRL